MRIFHIIVGLNVGGAEGMLNRLVSSYTDSPNYQHCVVSLTDFGIIGPELISKGVKVYSLGMHSVLGIPLTIWRLMRLIRSYRPDIVQTWMYHADLIGGLAARLAGNRSVIWGIRTTDIRSCSRSASFVRWLCAKLSTWLPSVIVSAAEASKRSHIAVGYDVSKMVVVPNGYDFSWLQASVEVRLSLREQAGFYQDDVVLGSLGRFHADKDQENFVRVAGLLAPRFSKLRFLMVGRNLTWNNLLLAGWIDQTGFKERFVLLGERKDVPQCLAAMDIFCLHSRTEGFPNVLAEAMAMGLPCITTNVGDAVMLLADTGLVVPKEDSPAMAKGVEQMLTLSPEARIALGLRAKARVVTEFSMELARQRFETIYQQVLNEN